MGRNTTPDGNAIFKTNMNEPEDVDTVSTGFGSSRQITPEECQKRIENLEREIDQLKKQIS